MRHARRLIWGAMGVALLVAISAAAMTATEAIQERHEAMEGIRDEMKTLGVMVKGGQPFDAEVVHASAAKIAEHLAEAADLFPEGSESGDVQTWAKPEIWTDRGHFDEIFESAHKAAVELQSVTEAEAFPPALGKLGNGCKSCHDMYRVPKQ